MALITSLKDEPSEFLEGLLEIVRNTPNFMELINHVSIPHQLQQELTHFRFQGNSYAHFNNLKVDFKDFDLYKFLHDLRTLYLDYVSIISSLKHQLDLGQDSRPEIEEAKNVIALQNSVKVLQTIGNEQEGQAVFFDFRDDTFVRLYDIEKFEDRYTEYHPSIEQVFYGQIP